MKLWTKRGVIDLSVSKGSWVKNNSFKILTINFNCEKIEYDKFKKKTFNLFDLF